MKPQAHLTPGGLSSRAGDAGLGAERHHTCSRRQKAALAAAADGVHGSGCGRPPPLLFSQAGGCCCLTGATVLALRWPRCRPRMSHASGRCVALSHGRTHVALAFFCWLSLIDFFHFAPPGLFLSEERWRVVDPRRRRYENLGDFYPGRNLSDALVLHTVSVWFLDLSCDATMWWRVPHCDLAPRKQAEAEGHLLVSNKSQ